MSRVEATLSLNDDNTFHLHGLICHNVGGFFFCNFIFFIEKETNNKNIERKSI